MVHPGHNAIIPIRVINASTSPVAVTISGRQVELGDDGRVRIGDSPDPRWRNRVTYPAGPQNLAPRSYSNIALIVRIPPRIAPDLYFLGFLVAPVNNGAGHVAVINELGAFAVIDVPGPRHRALQANLHVPGILLGHHVSGDLRVRNVGQASVRFWGENDTSSQPGGSPHQNRIAKSLVPTGRVRTFPIGATPAWPVGFVTMKVRLIYPGLTEAATKEVTISKRVLVISPWLPTTVILLVLTTSSAWLLRRKRLRRSANPDPVAT